MFQPVSNRIDFAAMEEQILSFWQEHETFQKSLNQTRAGEPFVFYDGPPFATGLPHYGHLLAGTIKDIVPRYQTMRGRYVERRFGWDCHGLPIEALAQEALGLAGTTAIVEAGIDVFNEQCRSMVQTYVAEWRKTVTRMGRWVDFDNDYKTMDLDFMETVWWVFKQLWDQGRIYKAHRIMPYSCKLSTPLSNFEANRNYQDVQDPSITCRFKVMNQPDLPETYFLAWTTTPWTLPSNLALCVGPDIDYVLVKRPDEADHYILAEARVPFVFGSLDAVTIEKRMKGSVLCGMLYQPLFPFFTGHPKSFIVLEDGFVTTEDGTGIVHMAPAYGEDDYRICRLAEIEHVDPLDNEGKFTDLVPSFAGLYCKDADKLISKALKDAGLLVHQSTIQHSYPFCERTETPLIYRAIDAWYARVEDIREQMMTNNDSVRWVPDYVGSKRFGNWLADAKDWNISRNRFWGSCIPVWVSEDGSDSICIGSISELEALSGQRVTDLHKHIVDKIEIHKDGKVYRRTPEVLDCWFESGAMPYAQSHYPFADQDTFLTRFPADFIAEGLDQTRGWFYTLMVLSTALFEKPAYQNVIVNGLILAENGQKMSKRLKNYPDPMEVIHRNGADAVRLYMIYSPVVRAENLAFSEDGVKQVLRDLLIPLWNAYSFFVTYANIDKWTPDRAAREPSTNPLDRWICSSLQTLVTSVTESMDTYDLQKGVRPFVNFIEDLTNWYIRRSRRRFWKSQDDSDKAAAYATLYRVLVTLSKVAAPFIPFISEAIYRNLRTDDMPESVHLCSFPSAVTEEKDPALEEQMQTVFKIVRMGRLLRTEHNLKVRQPLPSLRVVTTDHKSMEQIRNASAVICDELNVKAIAFDHNEGQLADLHAKADFRRLGPTYGKRMKHVSARIMQLQQEEIERLIDGDSLELIDATGEPFAIVAEDVVIERTPKLGMVVASEDHLVVALSTDLTPELVREGLAREFTSKLQNARKAADFNVTQRIAVAFETEDAELTKALEEHGATIAEEVLALELGPVSEVNLTAVVATETLDINGVPCNIKIEKRG
ncbi:MAG: isoleucine--tRNA ligase [Kiritimatiellia bacterium]